MARGLAVDAVLSFGSIELSRDEMKFFRNGGFLRNIEDVKGAIDSPFRWVTHQGEILGLSEWKENELRPKINFHSEGQA